MCQLRVCVQAAILDLLPGLEEDAESVLLACASSGELPLAGDGDPQTFFGNVFARGGEAGGTLR